jgi:hypothetical protein
MGECDAGFACREKLRIDPNFTQRTQAPPLIKGLMRILQVTQTYHLFLERGGPNRQGSSYRRRTNTARTPSYGSDLEVRQRLWQTPGGSAGSGSATPAVAASLSWHISKCQVALVLRAAFARLQCCSCFVVSMISSASHRSLVFPSGTP